MIIKPSGKQREIKSLGSASIDGTPLDYIVVMSAVVTVLAFIPFSITIGSGGIFPLSQGIFPLLGWILGPVGGALASGIGTLMGVFLAPHTAGIPPVSIFGAMVASFAAGCMVIGKQRKSWWVFTAVFFVVALIGVLLTSYINLVYINFVNYVNPTDIVFVLLRSLMFWLMAASFAAGCSLMATEKQRKYWWLIMTIFFVVALIKIFFTPYFVLYRSGVPIVFILGVMVVSFAAGCGCMVIAKERQYWWLVMSIFFVVAFYLYVSRAMNNGVSLPVIIKGSFIDWSGLLLFILPTRTLFARWINSQNLRLVWLGLFLGSWTVAGVYHISQSVITYTMFNWPEEVWIFLIPIMPLENLVRSLVGAFIGVRVISGLRAIGIMKPEAAIY